MKADTKLRDAITASANALNPDPGENFHRQRYSSQFLCCAQLAEWLSSRRLDFTARDLCGELECESSYALRWLRTVVLLDWVKVVKEGNGGRASVYRSRVRIKRIA